MPNIEIHLSHILIIWSPMRRNWQIFPPIRLEQISTICFPFEPEGQRSALFFVVFQKKFIFHRKEKVLPIEWNTRQMTDERTDRGVFSMWKMTIRQRHWRSAAAAAEHHRCFFYTIRTTERKTSKVWFVFIWEIDDGRSVWLLNNYWKISVMVAMDWNNTCVSREKKKKKKKKRKTKNKIQLIFFGHSSYWMYGNDVFSSFGCNSLVIGLHSNLKRKKIS